MTERVFDRLPPDAGLFMQVWADTFLTSLEETLGSLQTQLTAIQAAQATATGAARELARINSYTAPTNVLSAADVGTTATVTIAAHTRVYPVQGSVDVPDVDVAGGTVTGLDFNADYFVYYDDTTLTDTTPTYLATEDNAEAQVGAAAGRHFVGKVTTPVDGGGGTTGTGGFAPGGGGGQPIP